MKKIITGLRTLKVVVWLSIGVLLIGCTTSNTSTMEVPTVADNTPVTRATSTTIIMPTQTATQELPMPSPTATPEPTRTSLPTRTPTPSPWLVDNFSPFLFYNEGNDLYLIRPSGDKRFTSKGWLLEGQPWSPDGQKIILDLGSNSYPHAASLINLATGEVQDLFSNIYGGVYWSPDGKYIFSTLENNENVIELILYNVEQKTSETLLEILLVGGDKVLTGGWSPDSRKVAFVSKQNGQYDLYTIDVETRIQQQLTFNPEVEVLAAWSPLANELAVITSASERIESLPFIAEKLQIIDDRGNELHALGPFEVITTASWSPDGQRIVYSVNGQLCLLTLADFSSSCPFENSILAEYASAVYYPPAWSAEGRWLAFQSYGGELLCFRLFFVDLDNNTVIDPEGPCSTSSQIHWSQVEP